MEREKVFGIINSINYDSIQLFNFFFEIFVEFPNETKRTVKEQRTT